MNRWLRYGPARLTAGAAHATRWSPSVTTSSDSMTPHSPVASRSVGSYRGASTVRTRIVDRRCPPHRGRPRQPSARRRRAAPVLPGWIAHGGIPRTSVVGGRQLVMPFVQGDGIVRQTGLEDEWAGPVEPSQLPRRRRIVPFTILDHVGAPLWKATSLEAGLCHVLDFQEEPSVPVRSVSVGHGQALQSNRRASPRASSDRLYVRVLFPLATIIKLWLMHTKRRGSRWGPSGRNTVFAGH